MWFCPREAIWYWWNTMLHLQGVLLIVVSSSLQYQVCSVAGGLKFGPEIRHTLFNMMSRRVFWSQPLYNFIFCKVLQLSSLRTVSPVSDHNLRAFRGQWLLIIYKVLWPSNLNKKSASYMKTSHRDTTQRAVFSSDPLLCKTTKIIRLAHSCSIP